MERAIRNITIKDILNAYKSNGYSFFTEGDFNLNLFGIRGYGSESNKFDDLVGVAYKDKNRWRLKLYPATTDPGKYYLQNPLNKDGTLILKPGQYPGAFKVGYHNRSRPSRKYPAFEQVARMDYVRDNTKDSTIDLDLFEDINNVITGNFKTNIHRAHKDFVMKVIGRYSAGCQVVQSYNDFLELLDLGYISSKIYGNSFTYTLLNESELG